NLAEEETVDTAESAVETEPSVAEEVVPKSKKKKTKKKSKGDKPNIFVRIGRRLAKFWRDYNSERKKISWKPWPEVCKSALIVVVTVVIFAAVIFGMDTVFHSLFEWLRALIGGNA
ncbi:MAG: preprotein translocase subunit SecE, partial [Clostridia bacterium]|nr:preprotein translocase subunit SecE [Clostridia bacterium]